MKANPRTFSAAACLILGMLGCDSSKAELEQTKGQLQAVSAERDALKNQVNGLQSQVSALTQQLGEANAKLAAAAQPGAQPAAEAQKTTAHHRPRPPGTSSTAGSQAAEPGQPQQLTPAQQEQKAAEKQMTGKASMNN